MTKIDVGCAECGVNGGHALYCVACAEKFVGGYKDSGVPAVQTGLEQVSPDTPKDKALRLALEALEANQPVNYCMNSNGERFPMMHEDPFRFDRNTKAITAIKEALAQPEERNFCPRCGKRTADLTTIHTCTPPQSQWVGLTVDELIDLERKHLSHENLTQAIEAKLKEKNT